MLATTQWPVERAAHLTSLVWVCVLWLPESLMDLSALCDRLLCTCTYSMNSVYISFICLCQGNSRAIKYTHFNTQWGRVTHISFSIIYHHWFRQWPAAFLYFVRRNPRLRMDSPHKEPESRAFVSYVSFDVILNKRLHKQTSRWWFKTTGCQLWRHRNEFRRHDRDQMW